MRMLIVDADLLALERIRSQAEKSGHEVNTATTGTLRAVLRSALPDLLILDLDRGGDEVFDELIGARAEGLVPDEVVGFYSHIAKDRAERAIEAGCTAIPRGRFYRTLGDLLVE